jgi:hypothetical protein
MTNPIGRRLGRLESEIERRTDPGYGPVFRLIDDPADPENAKRLVRAMIPVRRDDVLDAATVCVPLARYGDTLSGRFCVGLRG